MWSSLLRLLLFINISHPGSVNYSLIAGMGLFWLRGKVFSFRLLGTEKDNVMNTRDP